MNSQLDSQKLKDLFKDSEDVQTYDLTIEGKKLLFIYCEGLCDEQFLNEEFLPTFKSHLINSHFKTATEAIENFHKMSHKRVYKEEEIIEKVYSGELIIHLYENKENYLYDLASPPARQTEETSAEVTVRGPRDGFVESMEINVALIRKRLKTNSLVYETFTVGERSKTPVGLLFVNDIARDETINHIRSLLKNIDIDALVNTNQLEELIHETPLRILPMYHYTGRPDFAVNSLLMGRFVLFIDGSPVALTAPVNLPYILKTGEDQVYPWFFNSFERIMRLAGLIIGILLPGFWVALSAFHQDQIPLVFLSSASQARQGVPLPTPVEALLLVLLFDLLKEAGLRLPFNVGQILGVVGGLIIGDAAIRAGITSPANVVMVATSTVATFTIANQSLSGVVSLLRIFVLVIASFTGLYGFFVASFLLLIYMANLRSFNMPYLAPIAPFNLRGAVKAIIHPPEKLKKKRPTMLDVKDTDRGNTPK
ncbi:hypothetical protein J2R98_000070 [Alkalibacillus filiformis]|uniref:Spore germination protein n=1 Tax=Alkalibacillus filiformis TaxID=200990 RepID=A0ABU0DP80_9BACI|nr:spore germination protein [Alkalibacillus filiformis]MDQ0350267.1 hypothetical protein [Alkalibacillus filiformis]